MSRWLNTRKIKHKFGVVEKPCHKLGYCPYGQLVEEFPIRRCRLSCSVFGHDCPVYYHAEFMSEDYKEVE